MHIWFRRHPYISMAISTIVGIVFVASILSALSFVVFTLGVLLTGASLLFLFCLGLFDIYRLLKKYYQKFRQRFYGSKHRRY